MAPANGDDGQPTEDGAAPTGDGGTTPTDDDGATPDANGRARAFDGGRDEFREYADWASGRSLLYERLARATADDDALLELAGAAPETQPMPNLLFGAVHDCLLAGVEGRIADFYATITDDPLDPAETDPFPAFRAFCLDNADAIRERLGSRLVQTNDVGRSAVVYPALSRVVNQDGGPLALVEVGSSAGLNLCWDRYRYEYDDRVVGRTDSPVTIASGFEDGDGPDIPSDPPAVASRVGVDLNPMDPTDPDDARWLRALVLPGERDRHERLAAATDLVAADPPEVVAGDAVDRLLELLDRAPADATIVVYSTLVLYQFPDEAVAALHETLAEHSRERDGPVHWLSGDPAVEVTSPTYRHVRFEDGTATSERLARFAAYGSWIDWVV